MARRRTLTALVLALGTLLAGILYRRRAVRRREHVDLYYDDGSMVSLSARSPETERLLPLAREILEAVRA
jgi:hypothetical protein